MGSTNGRRKALEVWFPVVARYGGVVLGFVCVIGTVLGHGLELAGGYVLATGMIAYKTVREAAINGEKH